MAKSIHQPICATTNFWKTIYFQMFLGIDSQNNAQINTKWYFPLSVDFFPASLIFDVFCFLEFPVTFFKS